ncbi:hypothetical protein ACFRH9_02755 [Peribacillus butanolivorans]|uniref:hypothetical protein n=1 Tax=Peribacillus butanolivorans TaxID=421767 RepID=UPI00366FDB2C
MKVTETAIFIAERDKDKDKEQEKQKYQYRNIEEEQSEGELIQVMGGWIQAVGSIISLIGQLRSNNEDKGDGDSSSVSRTNDDRHRIIFSLVNRQIAVPKSDRNSCYGTHTVFSNL